MGNEIDASGGDRGPVTFVVSNDQIDGAISDYGWDAESYTLTVNCNESAIPHQISGTVTASNQPGAVGQAFYGIYDLDPATSSGRLSGFKPGTATFPTAFSVADGQRLFVFGKAGGGNAGAGGGASGGMGGTGGVAGTGGNGGVSVAGAGWTQRGTVQSWWSVASSADGNKLVAVAQPGYIYTSADSGATWTQTGTQQVWSSVASSADGTKLVAVGPGAYDALLSTYAGGYIYTSGDSGATWTQTGSSQCWQSVASSADGTKLVAVAGDWKSPTTGYIYTSGDSGATWTQTGSSQYWQSVASSADGTKLVAVVNEGYIYTSGDSGATWTQTSSSRYWESVASSADGTKLVAGATDRLGAGYIFKSRDSGLTWTRTGPEDDFRSVASSADGTKLVTGADYIYMSGDSGATWTQTGSSQYWHSVASSADGTKLVAVVMGGYIYTWSNPAP